MDYSPEQIEKLFAAVNDINVSLKQFSLLERQDYSKDIIEIKTTMNHLAEKIDHVTVDHEDRLRCLEKGSNTCPHHDGLKEWQAKVDTRLENGESRFDELEKTVNTHMSADKQKEKIQDHTREYSIAFLSGLIAFVSAYILAKLT